MPTDFGFRFSTYLALGLACATLGYAEFLYLPSVSAFTFVVLALMVVAFRRDGRNELSLAMANRVGLVIGIAVIAYLTFQFFQPGDSLLDRLPLPAGLLPYLGPVFMVLIPAKLFRPKHVGDWWAMQGVGLAAVCLACVMEDEPMLAVLVTAYLIVAVWSLMLFYFRRGGGFVPPIPRANHHRTADGPTRVVSAADAPPRSRFGGIKARRPVSYLIVAAAAGFLLFILTPRTETPHWSLSSYREVGFTSDEQAPDLNRTGDLKDNRDRAFEVEARNRDGTPKLDLDPQQRWRGTSYVSYQNGRWDPKRTFRTSIIARGASGARPPMDVATTLTLEAAGPEAYVLEFDLNGKRKDPVQADPVWWTIGGYVPLATKVGTDGFLWFQLGDGSFQQGGRGRSRQFRQLTRPPLEPDLGPPFQMIRGLSPVEAAAGPGRVLKSPVPPTEAQLYLSTVEYLRFNPLPRVKTWTEALITRLAAEGSLPAEVAARYAPEEGSFPITDFEAVAKAINRHFMTSGVFTYGTENIRQDKSLDPVEDFLFNTRTGSCEWYATGLTLCLRSVGIPAQCVLGFKGCESEADGRYTVRQDHAHAWVEVLIPRPIPADFPIVPEVDAFREPLATPTCVWHWLSLDPTPATDAADEKGTGISGLWDSLRTFWLEFFNDFIVRYDPERRQRAAAAFEKWALSNGREAISAVIGMASVAVGVLIVRRLRRKSGPAATPHDSVPVWYREFLVAAKAAGWEPVGGETPREFGDRVAAAVPAAADGIGSLTEWLYRVRFAGESTPSPDVLAPAVSAVAAALTPTVPPTANG